MTNCFAQKSQKSIFYLVLVLAIMFSPSKAQAPLVVQPIAINAQVYDLSEPNKKFPYVAPQEATLDEVQKEIGTEIAINRNCFKKGMTWGLGKTNPLFGIYQFACNALPTNDNGTANCEHFHGDTWCYKKRSLLCINKLRLNRPAYFVPSGQAISNGWTEGIVKATPPVIGCSFATKADVDRYCTKLFGCNWIGADFHDGRYHPSMTDYTFANFSWISSLTGKGFYNFWTYAQDLPQVSQRYWVAHSDVYGANPNCWN